MPIIKSNSVKQNSFAVFGLLFGACFWGIVWYPYRLMQMAGISGVAASFYTYTIATMIAGLIFAKKWRGLFTQPRSIVWLSLVAGWTNLSYVLAVIDGEVVRVMLLFYLSPLWTLILAHFWLKERTGYRGFLVILMSLTGAFIMLFDPAHTAFPLPKTESEWLALSSGMGFALTNVITRKSDHLSIHAKSFAIWLGVVLMALCCAPFMQASFPAPDALTSMNSIYLLIIAVFMVIATLLVQYGVTKMPATRASVIFLFELVVAAIASYWLAGETMQRNEWIGGTLIIVAALFAATSEDTH